MTFSPPFGGQLPFKRPLEHGLAVDFELLLRGFELLDAVLQLAEEGFDFLDDAVLLGEWGKGDPYFLKL